MIDMDPLSTELRMSFAWTLKYAHRYDEAIRHLEQMLKEDPNLPYLAHYHLAWNYAMAGGYAEAVAECEKIHDAQTCAYVHARSGHRKQALKFAQENEVDDPVFTAATYFVLGDRKRPSNSWRADTASTCREWCGSGPLQSSILSGLIPAFRTSYAA